MPRFLPNRPTDLEEASRTVPIKFGAIIRNIGEAGLECSFHVVQRKPSQTIRFTVLSK
jgi:hypothetical protein